MKINDAAEIRRVQAGRTAGSPRTREAGAPAADRVSTESLARLEAAAATARAGAAQDRAVRLEAIEAAVKQGTFRPDPQRIAQRILEDAELTAQLRAMLER
ncbi:putative anti-sigma-28 factor, FlgM [Anaeromyxobacter sp. K]|uniref:flagellar biosynthesis anti-sigma factor FlgM n=1 Tax=Anaeromyxobacter sp. (strain K) TaxID=447217 RepID=UPI00015F8EBB|nr:flagellar biosynthesis anti-sigma factor FlgM [Anaeromyxobacter sp. K]ACG73736.1 putative anti-sigma-28 factor, FlgM [Anaeromyxobacter sp. K]